MLEFDTWKVTSGFPVRLPLENRLNFVETTTKSNPDLAEILAYDWFNIWGRDEQIPYFYNNDWTTWAYIAGRGSGKTRAGAEWIRNLIFERYKGLPIRIGVICPTNSDAEKVIIRGDSGILSVLSPDQYLRHNYNINQNKITFDIGHGFDDVLKCSVVYCFSAEEAERLRGNQFHFLWADEMAAWSKLEEILIQIPFCLRLKPPGGGKCQKIITTTPKPEPWLRDLFKEAQHNHAILFTKGSSYSNRANLSEEMFADISKYEGTRLGRQEIHGEILMENDESIIKREWIKLWNYDLPLPLLTLIAGSYDTAFTEKTTNDPSAGVMIAIFEDRDGENSAIFLDCWNEHLSYPDLRTQLLMDWEREFGDRERQARYADGVTVTIKNRRKPDCFVIENKASGQALLTDIVKLGVKVIKYSPGRGDDKYVRMNTIAYLFKQGRVYFPESRKYRGTPHEYFARLIEELVNFPLVSHDDYCDATSQLLLIFSKGKLISGDRTTRDEDEDSLDEHRKYSQPKATNPYMQI